MLESTLQLTIFISGIVAVLLTQQSWSDNAKKYAPIAGLIGQPAWLWVTYTEGLTGMFWVSCVYTLIWMLGLYNAWFRRSEDNRWAIGR